MDSNPIHKSTFPIPEYVLKQTATTPTIPYIPLFLKKPLQEPLFLTPYRRDDTAAAQSICSQLPVVYYLTGPPYPYTLADAERWVDQQLTLSPPSPQLPLQVIRHGDPVTGTLIGAVSLTTHTSHSDAYGEYELGYYLSPDFHGKGIMKKAVLSLLTWAQLDMRDTVKRVIVTVEEENWNSRRIVESIEGFEPLMTEEGERAVKLMDRDASKGGGERRILTWKMIL